MENLQYIEIARLHPHPGNPRKDLGDLTELADSIKAQGILQNLTVVPLVDLDDPDASVGNEQYTVIIGHRRLAAAAMAGLEKVPCVVADMDERQQARTMLMENMQRTDLTVYEQAQGFQMMMDLGDTVDEIAQRSGFSTTTVRRRLKMMELDQDTLKDVSGRQLSIMDFDKLAEIEDIGKRNELLKVIGTKTFSGDVAIALKRQKQAKNLPLVKEFLRELGAKEIEAKQIYNGHFTHRSSTYFEDWGEKEVKTPDCEELFYYLNEDGGYFTFYTKNKNAPAEKLPEEVKERRRTIMRANKALREKAADFFTRREAFMAEVPYTQKNKSDVLYGALIANGVALIDYNNQGVDALKKILGMDFMWSVHRGVDAADALAAIPKDKIPAAIYALFKDSKENYPFDTNSTFWPMYRPLGMLHGLYIWLGMLGYTMTDEEKQFMDGTHELYQDPEKEGKK